MRCRAVVTVGAVCLILEAGAALRAGELLPHAPGHGLAGWLQLKLGKGRVNIHPGTLPQFGYTPNCWYPWPAPFDWSHCRCPPTAVLPPISFPGSPPPTGESAPSGEKPAAPGTTRQLPPPIVIGKIPGS